MRTRVGLLGSLAAALLLSACDEAAPERDPATAPAASVSAPSPSPVPSSTPPATPDVPRPITIAVAGDVHFEGPLRGRLDDPATALSPATAALAAADVAVVNLETSVGEGGRPEPDKRYTFQAPATALTALAAAGVDVATMANNHALDYGREALGSTFAAVDASELEVVGVGRNVGEAFRPALLDVAGTTVATIGATIAATDPTADPTGHWAATRSSAGTADAVDPRRLLRTVRRADRDADVVVVYMHWGIQGDRCPTDAQQTLAADLVDAGADIVVGSHAHRVQGDGSLGEGYVAYGLGNYAWYRQSPGTGADTGVLTLTVQPPSSRDGRATVTDTVWEPARIGADGLPAPVTGDSARVFDTDRRSLRACAGLG